MKESKFIEQNKEKWFGFEKLLNADSRDPDKLSDFFIQITDDLSYARTFYNFRTIRLYLNNICQQLFYMIYKAPKKRGLTSFKQFWKVELPQIAYQSRYELQASFCIFLLAFLIGIVSSIHDPDFVRVILGDEYVNMTIENIDSGDPMAVYKKANQMDMVMGITLNNILVAVKSFLLGILWAIGSVIIILYNGIMVGTFQYFFIERGLFSESFLAIWLHGALEISAIVIAGAAGIVLGKGILAPGSYTRLQAFQLGAKKGTKLFIGIVPIIVTAAIIESFLTRYTEIPDPVRLILIILSFSYILVYFVWYPRKVVAKHGLPQVESNELQASPNLRIEYSGQIKNGGEILKDTFLFYRKYFNEILRVTLFFILIYLPVLVFLVYPTLHLTIYDFQYQDWLITLFNELFNYDSRPFLIPINAIYFAAYSFMIARIFLKDAGKKIPQNQIRLFGTFILLTSLVNAVIFSTTVMGTFIQFLVMFFLNPVSVLFIFTLVWEDNYNFSEVWRRVTNLLKGTYGFILGLSIIILLITLIGFFFLNSPFPLIYMEFLKWNLPVDGKTLDLTLIALSASFSLFTILIIYPIFLVSLWASYFSIEEINTASDLKMKLTNFLKS